LGLRGTREQGSGENCILGELNDLWPSPDLRNFHTFSEIPRINPVIVMTLKFESDNYVYLAVMLLSECSFIVYNV
jgi:hypothetical protein